MFTIYSDNDAGSTLVPNLFIDQYMRDANDAQIKVYLYLLRLMGAHSTTSISEIADQFNHTEKEVLRSLRYWEKRGILILEYGEEQELTGIHLARLHSGEDTHDFYAPAYTAGKGRSIASKDTLSPAEDNSPGMSIQGLTLPSHREEDPCPAPLPVSAPSVDSYPLQRTASAKSLPDEMQLEEFRSNKKRAQLLFVIEQYIGKPLSPAEIQSVYYISEELHFSDALIDYLLQYCIDRGKKDFRYIERVAVNWAEHGITTPKQAERAVSPLRGTRRGQSGVKPSANKFNQFEQNHYDFDALEREILSNQ